MSETEDKDDFLREIDELLGEDGDTKLSEDTDSLGNDATFGLDIDGLDINLDAPPDDPPDEPSSKEVSPPPRIQTKYAIPYHRIAIHALYANAGLMH